MQNTESSKEIRIISTFTIITAFFVVLVNVVSLYHINTLHIVTENLYNHPLKVSNASLNLTNGVLEIHRDMKDIVLFSSESEFKKLILKVDMEEKEVYRYLNIIRLNILGDEGKKLYLETYELFKKWKPIRDNVIELVSKKEFSKAILITKEEGARHVVKLENSAMILNQYAKNKANNFKNKAHNTFQNFKSINIILTILTLIVIFYFTYYIKKRIKNYIQSTQDVNERFELAIAGSNDGLWDWNLQDGTVYFSPRWKDMLGYRDDELPNEFKTWQDRVHPDDIDDAMEKIKIAHSDPSVEYNNVHRLRHKDGSWVWVLDRGQTIFDKDQKPIRMLGFHTDITKQKKLELELFEKDHLLQESQRLSTIGSWKLDFNADKLTWSDETYNIFELDKNNFEPSYENFINIIHPEDRDEVNRVYKESLVSKTPYEIVHRLLMKDGSIKYVNESCETVFDTYGKPIISIGTIQDITKQKLVEDKLINLKQQFEQFMEFMPANIIIKEDDNVIYANSSTNTFFKSKSIVGKTIDELFDTQRAKKIKEFEKEAYEKGFNEEILEITNNNNEKKIYRNMSFVIKDKKKRKLGIVSIDITKEYNANKEISRVLSAFERTNVSVVITDLSGDIQYVNPSWCKVTGYSRDELIGNNPRIVKSGAISEQTYKKMWEELTSGNVWHSELKNLAKDGTEFWEDSTIMPSFDNDGVIDGYISFKLEISDKIKLRQELEDKEEIMIAQSRHAAMGEMISMIAHQWRQPISVIAMDANNILVDVELDAIEKESLKTDLDDILHQTNYLSQTIDDFRNFFKPTKMKDEVLVSDVFKESFLVIDKSLENNNIEVINNFSTDTKVFIYSRELLQVFINILKNAKEALIENRDDNRKIINNIYEDNGYIIIKICDNAGGIKEDIVDDIFNPYFTTKDSMNGTGIGLYMSKTIIEKHFNGVISAYNNEDGACFEIKFPIMLMEELSDG